jgi:hypothetical protein
MSILSTYKKFNAAIIYNQRYFYEIVTFLVIVTFQPELGESTWQNSRTTTPVRPCMVDDNMTCIILYSIGQERWRP